MSISVKTRKALWSKSAGRCAVCQVKLSLDMNDGNDSYTIGQEAHIISKKTNGPRFDNLFPSSQLDSYDNLLLLCGNHHREIDSDLIRYTTDVVRQIKQDHIEWIEERLSVDNKKENDEELYVSYIEKWETLIDIDNWTKWTAPLLNTHFASIERKQFDNLIELQRYLNERVWPNRYVNVDQSLLNFDTVLGDFINEFKVNNDSDMGFEILQVKKLHQGGGWTARQKEAYDLVIERLVFELTKSANDVCAKVREFLIANYRIKEGILLIIDEPMMGSYRKVVYKDGETYPGLYEIRRQIEEYLTDRMGSNNY